MEFVNSAFRKIILYEYEHAGRCKSQLARKSGVDPKTISDIVLRKRLSSSFDTATYMLNRLGYDVIVTKKVSQ